MKDVHTLSGAYALDALSAEEAAEFRTHLEDCQACRDEVRELRAAAARLGESETLPPPAGLKGRVVAAAADTPQLPPRVPDASVGAEAAGSPEDRAVGPRWEWRTRRFLAVAAAVVLLALGALTVTQLAGDEGGSLDEEVAMVFDADDARVATLETEDGGALRVAVSGERDEMAVDTHELPELGEGRVYQLWVVVDDGVSSAGVLADSDRGAAMEMPPEGTQVAITVEPAGGSELPTSEPIAVVDPHDV